MAAHVASIVVADLGAEAYAEDDRGAEGPGGGGFGGGLGGGAVADGVSGQHGLVQGSRVGRQGFPVTGKLPVTPPW